MLLTVFKNHSLAPTTKVAPTCAPPAALLFTDSKQLQALVSEDLVTPDRRGREDPPPVAAMGTNTGFCNSYT